MPSPFRSSQSLASPGMRPRITAASGVAALAAR